MAFFMRVWRWRPLRYVVSGGTGAVVNLGTFLVLVQGARIWYVAAAALAYAAAIAVSFLMQKFVTFGDYRRDQLARQSARYVALQAGNIGVNALLVYLAVEYARMPYLFAQFASGILIAIYTFFILKRAVFTTAAVRA